MGFFKNLFGKKEEPVKKAFNKVAQDIKNINKKLIEQSVVAKDINKNLMEHSEILNTHSTQINSFNSLKPLPKQIKKLKEANKNIIIKIDKIEDRQGTLEERIKTPIQEIKQISRPNRPNRPNRPIGRPISTRVDQLVDQRPDQKQLDFDRFTEEEKNILNVFLEHRNMNLSYNDIGKSLNKSPTTIKNQINKIRRNHDIFETKKNKGQNRLKLVSGLEAKKLI